jgi:eukaryotic-like serine/threonine-protein kinase
MKLVAGELASKYRLERQLGQGGMGSVWLASDARLGRRVAIKFLDAPVANAGELRTRLLREARTIATLRNEHIVDIYDVDVLDDDTPYIVMEFVAGDSLSAYRGSHLEPGVVVDYILQACIALAEAHAIGIVHRDIKPDNMILMTDAPLGPQIKVLDFGIAKAATSFSSTDSFVTGENTIMGTPGYMSPEQTRSSSDIDARTDIWSLGCVLYELISGAPPFQGASFADVVAAILTREPAPLPAVISGGLQAVISRCLAKRPEQRFANVAELAIALRPFAADGDAAAQTVTRCRNYLGLGAHAAHTVVGSAEPRPKKPARPDAPGSVRSDRPASLRTTTTAGEPWHALEAAIPLEMSPTKEALMGLFAQRFVSSVAVSAGIVKLIVADAPHAPSDHDWFAIFMGNEQQDSVQDAGILGKKTFAAYVKPLRAYIGALGSKTTKIAIVVSASGELGEGVRATITDFRRDMDTIVVPIWLREIERAYRQNRLSDIVEHRLHDLHAQHNPFETPAADVDPMRYVGMGELVNQILVSLQTRRRVISILALPGSGKSTLVKLVQYSLPAREFLVIRCGDIGTTVAALNSELFSALDQLAGAATRLDTIPDASMQETLAAKLEALKHRVPRERLAQTLGSLQAGNIPIVVLEDADWFVAQIVEGEKDARDLWVALGEMSARRKLDLMISSVRGGELERAAFGAWRNPVRPQSVAVPQLSLRDVSYLVAELGAGTALFSPAAMQKLHATTNGHVGMLLALCSEAYRAARDAIEAGPLDVVVVEASHVSNASRRLAAVQRPIGTMFDAVLLDDERHLLYALSGKPRTLAHIKGLLAEPAALGTALEALEALGLVTHDGRRYGVAIPLLAAWAHAHFAPAPSYAEGRWQRKTKLIAIGAALSAVIFAAYVVLRRGQRTVARVTAGDGCTYMVDHPTRADYGTPVTAYVNRECGKPSAAQVQLIAYMSQSTISEVPEPGPATPCAAKYCSYERRLVLKEQASPVYQFKVTGGDQEVMTFSLERDALAGLKDWLAQIMSMISVVPVALGLGLAFYTDLLKAIRGWWRRAPLAGAPGPAKPDEA